MLTRNLDNTVRVWDVASGRELRRFEQTDETSWQISPLGIRRYGPATRERHNCGRSIAGRLFAASTPAIGCLWAVSPDGVYLLTSHPDGACSYGTHDRANRCAS